MTYPSFLYNFVAALTVKVCDIFHLYSKFTNSVILFIMKIVILDGYSISRDDLNWADFLSLGELLYFPRTEKDDVISRIGGAEAVLTSKCIIDKTVIDSCPNIKYIGVLATGYNNVDITYAKSKGITITNVPAYSSSSVAQFTFALLLEALNAVGKHNEATKSGVWHQCEDFCFSVSPQLSLAGKTMGIIGYGNIGKKVAEIAKAFSMKVLVYTPHPPENKTLGNAGGIGNTNNSPEFVDLDYLYSWSDVISLHCPLTEDNREFINRHSLSKMNDGVILINTARGPLICEFDLAVALKTGKVGIAALDVLEKEPPTRDNHLFDIENCIITPHIAWMTDTARKNLINIAFLNLEAFIAGDNSFNSV